MGWFLADLITKYFNKMGEILPDGTIQSGYGAICEKCGKEITTNIQGDEIGTHECKAKNLPIQRVTKRTCSRHYINNLSCPYPIVNCKKCPHYK